MIANVLLRPLPSEQQRLLLLMGQPEEFTPEQVAYAYGTSCRESVGSCWNATPLLSGWLTADCGVIIC